MLDFETLINDKSIQEEYKRTFLLNLFQKLCVKMNKDADLKKKIQNLYRQSFNQIETTALIVKRELDFEINTEESSLFLAWIKANLNKQNSRKVLSLELKKSLYEKQNGFCAVCGEQLGTDWNKIHVDHIIPFKLVGDELENNYQVLCDTCNECKSARVDYIFRSMLRLN